jgi:hypothetical protein
MVPSCNGHSVDAAAGAGVDAAAGAGVAGAVLELVATQAVIEQITQTINRQRIMAAPAKSEERLERIYSSSGCPSGN